MSYDKNENEMKVRRNSAQTTKKPPESNQVFTNMICKYEHDYRTVRYDWSFLKAFFNS